MAKRRRASQPRTERTSNTAASIAGRLLNGQTLAEAEIWLHSIALTDDAANENDRQHALALLGALTAMRTVAASALAQR